MVYFYVFNIDNTLNTSLSYPTGVLPKPCSAKLSAESCDDAVHACAGHSLGGALAKLAAYDIRKQLLARKLKSIEVVCYTFGAPRTGNHNFARDYNGMVPDTWSIINDQVTSFGVESSICCPVGDARHPKRHCPHNI